MLGTVEYIPGPFIGIEALQCGRVRKHELRSRYHALFPGVYIPRGVKPTFAQRSEGAWLWTRRQAVIAGVTAARMHGSKWLDDELPVELVWPNARPPQGITTSAMQLGEGETMMFGGLVSTSLVRTAFDLARRRPLGHAVARLDALGGAAPFSADDVRELTERHRGVRGVRQVSTVLDLHDPGAESPKETWLRLMVMRAGFPRPRTQIPVAAGRKTYYLDMGWEDLKVAIEYDGDHHRTDRYQFARDIVRMEDLAGLGWIVIRVAADTPPAEAIRRLRRAWAARTSSTLRSDREIA